MKKLTLLTVMLVQILVGQEEGTVSHEEPNVEWNGNLDAKYTVLRFAANSPIARLQFFQQSIPSTASQYRLEPYLNAAYTMSDVGFQMRLHGTYYDDRRSSMDLFEAFARYSPSIQTSFQTGKSVYTWGKGYAFNPVGFVNPAKDPENPELAQAGLLSAHVEYVGSYTSGPVQSFSALVVVVPPGPSLNDRFGDLGNTDVAVKLSALMWDTDFDVMTYQSANAPDRYGIDLSANILENLEVHGEASLARRASRSVVINGVAKQEPTDALNVLTGIRFLSSTNTTVIVEYYRNGPGMNEPEFQSYRSFLVAAADAGTPAAVQHALQTNQSFFRTSTLMRDYVYVKALHPEPFDWLYVTPSVFALVNVNDGSLLVAAPVSYKPATNSEFIFWPTLLLGSETSEFGSRQARQRFELWMRVFF